MKTRLTLTLILIFVVGAVQAQWKKVSRSQVYSEKNVRTKNYEDKSTAENNVYITWQNGEIKIVCNKCERKVFTYTVTEGRKSQNMDNNVRIDTYQVIDVETGEASAISIGYKDGVAINMGVYDGKLMILLKDLEDF